MRKIFLLALIAFSLYSCSEDEVMKNDQGDDPVAVIRINVEGGALTRAVEDGHPGNSGAVVKPAIEKVNVLAYSESKSLLTDIALTVDQMKIALYGDYTLAVDGTANTDQPAGASIALPRGTRYIDVVLNQSENPDNTTNINYFNRVLTDGSTTFGRTPLASTSGLLDLETKAPVSGGTNGGAPIYEVGFTVQPNFARMEVLGGINVAPQQDYIDYFNNKWVTLKVSDFITYVNENLTGFNVTLADLQKTDGCVAADGKIALFKGANTDQINLYGAMIANKQNTFDHSVLTNENIQNTTLVYVPEYYWAYKGALSATNPEAIDGNKIVNANKTSDLGMVGNTGIKWYNSGLLDKATQYSATIVQWCPNIYHAIDVEEIYINNIKVLGNNATPNLHAWPGSASNEYWPKWYEAYHEHGWHAAGNSASNTFLCMANMWDRITDVKDDNSKDLILSRVPEVGSTSGNLTMKYVYGKAVKKTGVSEFCSQNRNLGIADCKAAAYVFYPQLSTVSDTDKEGLGATLPHLILKVKAYASEENYEKGISVPNKNFITIRLFKDENNAYVKNFKSANIYRVDLNNITQKLLSPSPVPNGVNTHSGTNNPIDPDPEMPGASMSLTVQVLNWTIQNITPEI